MNVQIGTDMSQSRIMKNDTLVQCRFGWLQEQRHHQDYVASDSQHFLSPWLVHCTCHYVIKAATSKSKWYWSLGGQSCDWTANIRWIWIKLRLFGQTWYICLLMYFCGELPHTHTHSLSVREMYRTANPYTPARILHCGTVILVTWPDNLKMLRQFWRISLWENCTILFFISFEAW